MASEIMMPVAARKASAKKHKAHSRAVVKKKAVASAATVLAKASSKSRAVQTARVMARAARWAGSKSAAAAWFKTQPIPALDGRTAEDLVNRGEFEAVLFYLESMDAGAFA